MYNMDTDIHEMASQFTWLVSGHPRGVGHGQ